MAEIKHTPTPWRVESDTTLIWGACDPDDLSDFGMGYPIAGCRTAPISSSRWCKGPDCDQGDANAAHIVKCVNMHDELVEALETLRSDCQTPIDMYERNGPEFTSPQGNEYESTSFVMDKFAELVASIDAALAKARGETNA